jgi:uncharacterized membrane protein
MSDIHDIVNRVTQELDSDKRRMMIENYINRVASRLQLTSETEIASLVHNTPDEQVEIELLQWKKPNGGVVAYKISEAVRIILRQELLGEK